MPSFFTTALLSVGAATLVQADYTYKLMGQKAVVSDINTNQSSECPTDGGAHLIVARASTEPAGFGIIGAVKDQVLSRLPGSTAEAVDYPATLSNYPESESDGVVAMKGLVADFIAQCPGTPLVLMGYSQGAQVTADTLVGQDDVGFGANVSTSSALSDSVLSRVAAGIMMGDPSFVPAETFHVGNATNHGLFPRQNVANFDATGLSSRLKTYCNAGDPYCAGGNFSQIIVHLQYVTLYGTAAADFVVDGIAQWYAENGGSSNSSSTATGGAGAMSTPCATATVTKPTVAKTWLSTRTARASASGSAASAPPNSSASKYSSMPLATSTPAPTTSSPMPPSSSSNAASQHGFGGAALALVGAVVAAALS